MMNCPGVRVRGPGNTPQIIQWERCQVPPHCASVPHRHGCADHGAREVEGKPESTSNGVPFDQIANTESCCEKMSFPMHADNPSLQIQFFPESDRFPVANVDFGHHAISSVPPPQFNKTTYLRKFLTTFC